MATPEIKKKADLKVIILGEYSVGKTCFVNRYIEGKFGKTEATIGAAFFLKQWGPYNVAVWDTAGDERFSGLSSFYCRNAGAAILAFDLCIENTFETLKSRFVPLVDQATEDNCLKVIVGTKLDLLEPSKRKVTVDEARKFSREINPNIEYAKLKHDPYFETSSLQGINVDEVFEYIFGHCLPLSDVERIKMKNKTRGTVDLGESTAMTPEKKGGCC
ncbi:ras-related protein Rab-20-like [Mytilus galloprovincialis]|uniref:ras-related protein Rab-20-like n=1 Tax=Mytilus edulis TaxID=6550 RepID=UPI0039EEA1A4